MLKKNLATLLAVFSLLFFVGIASAQESTPEPAPTEAPPTVIVVESSDSNIATVVQEDLRLLLVVVGVAVAGAAVNLFVKLFIQFREKYPREAKFILDAGDVILEVIPGPMLEAEWAALRRRIEGKQTVQDLRDELNK